MPRNNKYNNPFIPDLARLVRLLSERYRSLREQHNKVSQKVIDKRLETQIKTAELLQDARIMPYVTLGEHLTQNNNNDR